MVEARRLTAIELGAIVVHAQRCFPEECVGFVLHRGETRRVMPCRNAQATLHRRDPTRYAPPTDAFAVSALDVLRLRRRRQDGWSVIACYHSHTARDAAVLSAQDVLAATAGATAPAFWGHSQVVVSLDSVGPLRVSAYTWDVASKRFVLTGAAVWDLERRTRFRQVPGFAVVGP